MTAFPINDTVGAWVPHGRFVIPGAGSGPLAGLSFAVKDVFDVAGYATGAGNPTWLASHAIPERSSPMVEQLLAAGATLVGKTLTDELAYSIHGDNVHYGTPLNVRAPGRVPGGSSSGSAAAVAAGLCDFALATDTGGSTRVPASYCGLWGLRTTHDALPRTAMVPLHPGFDTPTWLACDGATFGRVAEVLLAGQASAKFSRVLMLDDALAQADAVFHSLAEQIYAALAQSMPAQRTRAAASPQQMPTQHANVAAQALEHWREIYVALAAHEAWQVHGEWITAASPRFGAAIAGRWELARQAGTRNDVDAARASQASIRAEVRALLGNDAVAVLPSAASVAPLLDAPEAEIDEVRRRTLRITCIAGLAGLPQVSIPGWTADGLPIGISLLGPAGSDRALVQLAMSLAHLTHPQD
ncbi:amidase [Duganella sp. PWIR1]